MPLYGEKLKCVILMHNHAGYMTVSSAMWHHRNASRQCKKDCVTYSVHPCEDDGYSIYTPESVDMWSIRKAQSHLYPRIHSLSCYISTSQLVGT